MNSNIVHSITHELLNHHLHHCTRSTSGNILLTWGKNPINIYGHIKQINSITYLQLVLLCPMILGKGMEFIRQTDALTNIFR